jgi:hypothetical protein
MIHLSNKLTKTCVHCGNEFTKSEICSKKVWEIRRYCSRNCTNSAKIGVVSKKKGISTGKPAWNSGKRGLQVAWNKGIAYTQIMSEKHYLWKGDDADLVAKHSWVVRRLDRPKRCDFCGDGTRKMYHWSNISGKYLRDVSDYQRLCVPCHKKFDLDKLKNK